MSDDEIIALVRSKVNAPNARVVSRIDGWALVANDRVNPDSRYKATWRAVPPPGTMHDGAVYYLWHLGWEKWMADKAARDAIPEQFALIIKLAS